LIQVSLAGISLGLSLSYHSSVVKVLPATPVTPRQKRPMSSLATSDIGRAFDVLQATEPLYSFVMGFASRRNLFSVGLVNYTRFPQPVKGFADEFIASFSTSFSIFMGLALFRVAVRFFATGCIIRGLKYLSRDLVELSYNSFESKSA